MLQMRKRAVTRPGATSGLERQICRAKEIFYRHSTRQVIVFFYSTNRTERMSRVCARCQFGKSFACQDELTYAQVLVLQKTELCDMARTLADKVATTASLPGLTAYCVQCHQITWLTSSATLPGALCEFKIRLKRDRGWWYAGASRQQFEELLASCFI